MSTLYACGMDCPVIPSRGPGRHTAASARTSTTPTAGPPARRRGEAQIPHSAVPAQAYTKTLPAPVANTRADARDRCGCVWRIGAWTHRLGPPPKPGPCDRRGTHLPLPNPEAPFFQNGRSGPPSPHCAGHTLHGCHWPPRPILGPRLRRWALRTHPGYRSMGGVAPI
jgi:hypothetical protein